MNNDCHWVESKLEDFLSDSADSEVRTRIESHLKTCPTCLQEVEGYGEIDKRVRAYFEHQLARAESGVRLSLRPMRLATAFAAVGAIALAVWMGMPDTEIAPAPEEARLADSTYQDTLLKAAAEGDVLRAKPAEDEAVPDDVPTTGPNAIFAPLPEVANDFYVTDTAGYSQTLADYSGSILVLGVFEASGHDSFEDAYIAYGTDARVSFVGVSLNSDIQPENTTFPLMSNQDSSLLDTPAGAFTIVGPDGTILRRGSFNVDSLDDILKANLEQLNTR